MKKVHIDIERTQQLCLTLVVVQRLSSQLNPSSIECVLLPFHDDNGREKFRHISEAKPTHSRVECMTKFASVWVALSVLSHKLSSTAV